ncbi:MAG: Glycogen synthase [Planctomycetes bacterium]|nr:Glycogen synthase [Planctomycetota bacterium]
MLGWEYPPHLSGGLGTACHGLTHALSRRGVPVAFVLPRVSGDEDRPPSMEFLDPGADVVEIDAALLPYATEETYAAGAAVRGGGRYGPDLMAEVARYARAVRRAARKSGAAVVHGHDWMTFPAAREAARILGVPLVLHVHSIERDRSGPRSNPAIEAIERDGVRAADRVVCVSGYTAGSVAEAYGADPAKMRVVHNAPARSGDRTRRGGRRRIAEPVVLFLGRVTYQKGPGVFLEAAARVVAARPRVKFVVAGDGDLLRGIIERAASLGLARHVHFTGFLGPGDVDRAYRDADLYVLPSVSEPFGITPLEAAQRGVPVLLSERSGVAEVMPSLRTFDPADPVRLAEMIEELLASPSVRRRMASRARAEAAALSWDRQAARLEDVYREVLA